MSGLRFYWLSLTSYIHMITSLHELQHQLGKPFNFDAGKNWAVYVWAKDISVKTADIVMYDRQMDKISA